MNLLPPLIGIGFLLASYALFVEYQFNKNKRLGLPYRALCDIGMFSCTKVFSSEFGHVTSMIGLPAVSNAAVGMAFYFVELLVERQNFLLLILSGLSCVGSVGLFYILTVVMHDFCIVCFSVYVVNFLTFFTAMSRWRARKHAKIRKEQ